MHSVVERRGKEHGARRVNCRHPYAGIAARRRLERPQHATVVWCEADVSLAITTSHDLVPGETPALDVPLISGYAGCRVPPLFPGIDVEGVHAVNVGPGEEIHTPAKHGRLSETR